MKVFIQSLSKACQASFLEVAQYRRMLEHLGYSISTDLEDADVVILNTCGYSQERENSSLSMIESIKKSYPNKKVILGGCLTVMNLKNLKNQHPGEYFQADNLDPLLQALRESTVSNGLITHETPDIAHFKSHMVDQCDLENLGPTYAGFFAIKKMLRFFKEKLKVHNLYLDHFFQAMALSEDAFYIQAAKGCLGQCTYCSIIKARGVLKSMPLHDILQVVDKARSENKKEIVLSAEDIGAWGQDIGASICDLILKLNSYAPDMSFVIHFCAPQWFEKYEQKLIEALAKSRVVSIYVPFHSGSDEVIKRMGRKYSTRKVVHLLQGLKQKRPDMVLRTNIMHSFPGETWKEYFLSLYYALSFDLSVSLTYTPRPGTAAAKFTGQIPPWQKNTRQIIGKFTLSAWNLVRLALNMLRNLTVRPRVAQNELP